MSTCKDCIHYEVCERKDGTSTYTIESPSLMVTKEINCITCSHFKDRSKFIDVSELQQNVIRPLTNRCAEYTKCQTCLACAVEIREYCAHYKKIEQALKEREKE